MIDTKPTNRPVWIHVELQQDGTRQLVQQRRQVGRPRKHALPTTMVDVPSGTRRVNGGMLITNAGRSNQRVLLPISEEG